MSFEAMAWATKQKIKSSQKLVLLMLSSMADNDKCMCWPKHSTLADNCGMSVASLKDQLKSLSESRLIEIIHQSRDGVSLPNVYRVNLGGVGQNLASGGSESGCGVGQNLAGVGQNLATDTVIETVIEKQSLNLPSPQAAPAKPGGEIGYSSDFLKFWEIYPEKTGKGQAWESWKKRKAPIPEISQVLKSVEDNKASFKWRKDGGQFVPMPSTWINQRRWEDEAGSTQDTSRPNRFIDDTPPQGLKTGNYNGETF